MSGGRRLGLVLLLGFGAGGLLGVDCGPSATPVMRVPKLVDERGEHDRDAFEALVEAIEESRDLAFVRDPVLATVPEDDPELAELAQRLAAFAPIPGTKLASPRAVPDLEAARVVATAPPDPAAVGEALARILDEQHYPRLVAMAPTLPGDGGVAIRALLQASATLTAAGGWPRSAAALEPLEVLRSPTLGLYAGENARLEPSTVWSVASLFLLQREDREQAFRKAPLSTKQLLSSRAYEGSDRPLLLVGPAPPRAGCTVGGDESVGLAVLLLGAAARGAPVDGPALAGWKGDRLVRYACEDGSAPWIYVVELERPDQVAGFRALLPATLPVDPATPGGSADTARRLVAWYGVEPADAQAFAATLETREVRDPAQLLP